MLRGFVIECRVRGRRIGYLSGFTTASLPVIAHDDDTAMVFDRCEMADRITARINCAGQEPVWVVVEIGMGGTEDESGNCC